MILKPQNNNISLKKHEIRYLLKDKYNFSEAEIEDFFKSNQQKNLTPNAKTQLEQDLKQLEQNYPLAYIIGWTPFLNCHIDLRYKTLIPRPETEYWTEKVIESLPNQTLKMLDLFCGSGCIGIALIKAKPTNHTTFADINPNAIQQTQLNCELNKLPETQYQIIQSDLFQNLNNQKFDVIVANPPYISTQDPDTDESIKFEPQEALFANNNGIAVIENFLKEVPNHLNPSGKIYMEFGHNQKEEIKAIIAQSINLKAEFYKDQFGKDRWVQLRHN